MERSHPRRRGAERPIRPAISGFRFPQRARKKDPEAGMSQGGSGRCTTSGRFVAATAPRGPRTPWPAKLDFLSILVVLDHLSDPCSGRQTLPAKQERPLSERADMRSATPIPDAARQHLIAERVVEVSIRPHADNDTNRRNGVSSAKRNSRPHPGERL
jgi:hypothetical protein